MRASRTFLPLLAAFVLAAGCREAKVASYRVPKEKDPELPGMAAAGDHPAADGGTPAMAGTVPTAAGDGLSWTAPAAWKAKAASAMRKGSYSVPGSNGQDGDLSITAFPGDVGGELANVNRWRGQVQLPALSEAELPAATAHLTQNGLTFTVVNLTGSAQGARQRILGAIVPYAGSTWFFKLAGPDDAVAKAEPDFRAFLQTVKPPAQP